MNVNKGMLHRNYSESAGELVYIHHLDELPETGVGGLETSTVEEKEKDFVLLSPFSFSSAVDGSGFLAPVSGNSPRWLHVVQFRQI